MKKCFLSLFVIAFLFSLFTTDIFAKGHTVASYLKLPLSFIKNDEQKDPSILYYEQGRGHVTAFSKEGISFALTKLAKIKDKSKNSEMVTLTPSMPPLLQ